MALVIAMGFLARHWLLNDSLYRAVRAGKAEAVRSLLRQGADPNHHDRRFKRPVVAYALNSGATLKALLEAGADPNATDGYDPAIIQATRMDHLDVVLILLRFGADVDALGADRRTALIAAVEEGDSPKMVRALLDAGARVDVRNAKGYTPLRLSKQILLRRNPAYLPKGHFEILNQRRARRLQIDRLLTEAGAGL